MDKIDYKIEKWKNKLLDMGKRNRLLNYKEYKRTTLKFKKPNMFDLWNDFVIDENAIEFPFVDEENEKNEQEINITFDEFENSEKISSYVITNQTIKEQQKTLRNLRNKAKTAIEEQGVNVLYLAFGFLKWQENEHSQIDLYSPLVLVPVSISVESITSPFVLNLYEDEIILNPTLKYKMENDFGIILDEYDSENDLKEYFKIIKEIVNNEKWEIIEEASLSLFSFLKINMYNDLNKYKDEIRNNPIIKVLAGETTEINKEFVDLNNFDFDKNIKPLDTYNVVDADSSQQEAIYCAKNGMSFVLQGPPGTGKSQTITNIIAECIASDKKILFVSEKMAALDVVYKRLTDAGLNDFCLKMHNYKASKKAILEQLDDVLKLSGKKAILKEELYRKLDLLQSDKEKLNKYSEEIFEKVEPLNKTIYEVYGYIANLDEYDDVIFNLQDVDKTTNEKINKYIYLLNQYSNILDKMDGNYKNNPWYGANIKIITNELRHDINAKISKLIVKFQNFIPKYEEIVESLNLNSDFSIKYVDELNMIFEKSITSPIISEKWLEYDNIENLLKKVTDNSYLKNSYEENLKKLKNIIENEEINLNIHIDESNLMEKEELTTLFKELKNILSDEEIYSNFEKVNNIDLIKKDIEELKELINQYKERKDNLLSIFESNILYIDYNEMYNRFKVEYSTPLKFLNKQYRCDIKLIKENYKDIVKKISDESVIDTLKQLKQLEKIKNEISEKEHKSIELYGKLFNNEQTNCNEIINKINIYEKIKEIISYCEKNEKIFELIEEDQDEYKSQFENLYCGINTNWNDLISKLKWSSSFKEISEKFEITDKQFITKICTDEETIEKCKEYYSCINVFINEIKEEYEWFLNLFEKKEIIYKCNIFKLIDKLQECKNGLAKLEEWIDFKFCKENCENFGLENYIEKIDELDIKPKDIIPVFKKRFYRLWLDCVLNQFPAVMNFRRKNHEDVISEFSNLDKLQFEIAKSRIKKKLIDNLPSMNRFTSGRDELTILKRELGKQRKIMPIRKLFKEIPSLVLTLKPCLMMSPLSVSIFLDSDRYKFDIVIFDEASQVCTENAIGAILRGKQVIIAGDSKQLPPTNFFTSTTSGEDYDIENEDEDEYDDDAYESVLDEANLFPEKTLLWHYRSRHEHLIAFSNAKIYRNSLITFPSNIDKSKDNGVEYIYVKEGIYDRGGKNGNQIEAKKVAELVFEHFKNYPERSLGVIAFGEIQQQAIENEIRQIRLKNQEFETFFKEESKDPFFVKNLENVQGDERDTIIFSIGYAKDSFGKMQMLFGPLSKTGGERRLNVAITRAKYNVKLVGSILPTDIEIERISAEGPKLLRSYIDFAINGIDSLLSEVTEGNIVEHDSPFEEAVYKFLIKKGYNVVTQVGCSGYRIDMAVKHPTLSGTYILGIECDGASYHSARTARERDRLRQDVLENMGWKIYRIWSTDWIKDSIFEGNKLINAIEETLMKYSIDKPKNKEEKKMIF